VLQPSYVCEEHIDPKACARRRHFKAFDLIEGESETALALRWKGFRPTSARRPRQASPRLSNTISERMPLYVMVDGDIAQTLGAILRTRCASKAKILVIDGVVCGLRLHRLGRIRMPSQTVPVTVKSWYSARTRVPAPGARTATVTSVTAPRGSASERHGSERRPQPLKSKV